MIGKTVWLVENDISLLKKIAARRCLPPYTLARSLLALSIRACAVEEGIALENSEVK